MHLYYFKDPAGNFGDDLNEWLWPELLPGLWDDDGTWFSGVGTIISSNMPPASRWIVLGSGAGYDPAPVGFGGDGWHIVALRGRLSARVLNLPERLAVTDAAILLTQLSTLQPVSEDARHGVVFVPHNRALEAGRWDAVAERAGVEFLDPRGNSRQVIERIRTAKLVLADAMHAAIVADTMRVPWIPLMTSGRISSFKWLDWTDSMELPYEPTALPAPSLADRCRGATLHLHGERHAIAAPTPAAALAHFAAQQRLKRQRWWRPYSKRARKFLFDAPRIALAAPPLSLVEGWASKALIDRAAAALARAASRPAFLSSDQCFAQRTEQMAACLDQVRKLATPRTGSRVDIG